MHGENVQEDRQGNIHRWFLSVVGLQGIVTFFIFSDYSIGFFFFTMYNFYFRGQKNHKVIYTKENKKKKAIAWWGKEILDLENSVFCYRIYSTHELSLTFS